jgi:hypothetical protein
MGSGRAEWVMHGVRGVGGTWDGDGWMVGGGWRVAGGGWRVAGGGGTGRDEWMGSRGGRV